MSVIFQEMSVDRAFDRPDSTVPIEKTVGAMAEMVK